VLIPEPEMVVYEDRFMVHAERAAEGQGPRTVRDFFPRQDGRR
jgi:hypothetical protein